MRANMEAGSGSSGRPSLLLHAGPGKTGSSAVQKWLRDQHAQLLSDGYLYPEIESDNIFAGNAEKLQNILQMPLANGRMIDHDINIVLQEYKEILSEFECHSLILSDEMLSKSIKENLETFRKLSREIFNVEVILVVREPYSWMWSSWGQLIKKGGQSGPFRDFALRNLLEYSIIYSPFLDVFDDISLVPYSATSLLVDVAKAMGLDPERYHATDMQRRIVNRSLTQEELNILMCVNSLKGDAGIAVRISDFMLQRSPEATPHMSIDPEVVIALEEATRPIRLRMEAILPGCAAMLQPTAPRIPDGSPRGLASRFRRLLSNRRSDREADVCPMQAPEQELLHVDFALLKHILEVVRGDHVGDGHLLVLQRFMREPAVEADYADVLPDGFSVIDYLVLNEDVLRGGGDPIQHYLSFGHMEERPYRRYPPSSSQDLSGVDQSWIRRT